MSKKEERLLEIQRIINEEEKIKVSELAKRLHITPETLRTDLNELENQHVLVREHGYARLTNSLTETPIMIRTKTNADIKKKIVYKALQEIKDGQTIYLDAGSTLILGIPFLRNKKKITVITNSILGAYQLAALGIDTIMLGGTVLNEGGRTYGYFCTDMLDNFNIDIAFVGAAGINNTAGIGGNTIHYVGLSKKIIKQSKRIVCVFDNSKFNISSPYNSYYFSDIDAIYTNELTEEQFEIIKDTKEIIQVKTK